MTKIIVKGPVGDTQPRATRSGFINCVSDGNHTFKRMYIAYRQA